MDMTEFVRLGWLAVRPITAQQRFLAWCGMLLTVSGIVHAAVAAVDGGPWLGAVSWRKPVVFALSFGILLLSTIWIMRQLPQRRWSWLPVGILAVASVLEVAVITLQRWRGVPSHFNTEGPLDTAVFGTMALCVALVVLAVVVLLLWALVQFRGEPAARVAVLAGLAGVLASGLIGQDMIAEGEVVLAATGEVPAGVVFGAAGSAKLAHAVAMHGLQLLGLMAIGLGLGTLRVRTRAWVVALAAAGYAAAFASITATAYAGRAATASTPQMAVLGLAGVLIVLVAVVITLASLRGGRRAGPTAAFSPAATVVAGETAVW
jgi:uncharacterized membrane protein